MDTVIREVNVRARDGLVDIGFEGERIVAVEPNIERGDAREFDGGGGLALPGFVNCHMHLDKCMIGNVMRPNRSQTLQEAVEITWDHKRTYDPDEIVARADPVVESAIQQGTTAIRGFADVDTIGGLTPIQALLKLREKWKNRIHFEVVAFPQEGILRDPGCDKLMTEAVELGADIVGGMPWFEETDRKMWEHIDFCLDLAERHDKDVHMLVDDTDDPNSRSLEYLAVRTKEIGYEGRVSASHCGALAAYDHTYAEKVMGLVRDAGITIVSNAHISLVLDGRNDRGRVRRGTTRVKELLGFGVNIAAAQDDVNDPYYPFGRCDQLEVAQYTAHVAQLTYPSEIELVIDMVTNNAARAMRLGRYGLDVGDNADVVVMPVDNIRDALRLIPPRTFVFYRGRLTARSSLTSELVLEG